MSRLSPSLNVAQVFVDTSKLEALVDDVDKAVGDVTKKVAFMIQRAAQRNITVKHIIQTGALHNGMTAEPAVSGDVVGAVVGNNNTVWRVRDSVSYGIYQELGTRLISPRPFLGPAFEEYRNKYPNMLKEALEKKAKNG